MSVLFMEGFEDIESRSDLLARGETGVGALVYSGVDTARYAGGKSLYRGYYGAGETQYIFQRPLPQLKDSVNTSMSVMLSSNSVQRGINSNVNRGPNGEYVAGMNTSTASTNGYLVSPDGINWKGRIAGQGAGTFPYGISSLLWLPNKNLWLAVGGVNTGNTIYWGVSANLEGPYTISTFTVSGTSISQLRPALYYDAPTDTAFVVTTSGGLWRYNQTANTWANMMINPFAAAVTYPMAVTNGTRWYSAAASSLYYSDDVSTGTMTERPGMFTSASVASLAYGNNTLVVAVIGNRIAHLYYSKDEGVTFTGILLPGVSTAVNSATMVAFFKGKFYATATGGGAGTVFTSTDGVTWTSEKTTGNTIPPSPGSVQLAATSDYLYYGTTSMPMILYSSTGTDVNSMPNGYVDNVNFVAGYGTGLYLNLQPTRSLQVQIGTAGTDAVLRAGLPNGTQVQISPNVVIERDKWALLEMSAVRNSATSMDVSISYNGMPVYSNSIATPLTNL